MTIQIYFQLQKRYHLEIPFNTTIDGSIETAKDIDIFKIKLDTADGVYFKTKKIDNYFYVYVIPKTNIDNLLKIMNESNWDIRYDVDYNLKNVLSFTTYGSEEKGLNLDSGEYYIVIFSSASITTRYTLRVESAENTSTIQLDSITLEYCKNNLAECGISVDSSLKYTQEDLDSAKSTQKEECKTNPKSCGIEVAEVDSSLIYSKSDLDTAKSVSKNEAIANCQENPASCGIQTVYTTGTCTCSSSSTDFSTFQLSRDYINSLPTGWNLVGTSLSLSDFSIFQGLDVVWAYQNGNWMNYNPDSILPPQIVVDDFSGLWIKK